MEKFIERGTDYPLRNGMLTVYETNCACENVKFHFDQYIFTLMLAGHKTVVTENMKVEFFPGTFFIPEKGVINEVAIPNATIDSPTKCLSLELNPAYIQTVYEEVLYSDKDRHILYNRPVVNAKNHFFSNDQLLIKTFSRLYDYQLRDHSSGKELIEELIIREMLLRIFSTEGVHLLQSNFEKSITDDGIQKAVSHIRSNIKEKITVEHLAKISGLGQTTFFKKFKQCTGYSPIDYIIRERIRQAKVMMQKNRLSLQEIAYKCGFNSYEYFCSSFKKIEKMKPTEFRTGVFQTS